MTTPFATPGYPAAPHPTPSSFSRRVTRAPIHNPFDKFTQPEFDAWIGDLTGAIKCALGREEPEDVLTRARERAERDAVTQQGDEDELEDSFAEVKARRAAKGKDKATEAGNEDQPIVIGSDSEEEASEEEHDGAQWDENWGAPIGSDGFEDESEGSGEVYSDLEQGQNGPTAQVIEILSDDEAEVQHPLKEATVYENSEQEVSDEEQDVRDESSDSDEGFQTIMAKLERELPERRQRARVVEDYLRPEEVLNDREEEQAEEEAEPFPPAQERGRSVDLSNPWAGPSTYAEDFYSGGNIRADSYERRNPHVLPTEVDNDDEVVEVAGPTDELDELKATDPAFGGNSSPPVELPDPWSGPQMFAEDFYAGGDLRESDLRTMPLSPSFLTPREDEVGMVITPATFTPDDNAGTPQHELQVDIDDEKEEDVPLPTHSPMSSSLNLQETQGTLRDTSRDEGRQDAFTGNDMLHDLYGDFDHSYMSAEGSEQLQSQYFEHDSLLGAEALVRHEAARETVPIELSYPTTDEGATSPPPPSFTAHVNWNWPPAFPTSRVADGPGHLQSVGDQVDEIVEISDDEEDTLQVLPTGMRLEVTEHNHDGNENRAGAQDVVPDSDANEVQAGDPRLPSEDCSETMDNPASVSEETGQLQYSIDDLHPDSGPFVAHEGSQQLGDEPRHDEPSFLEPAPADAECFDDVLAPSESAREVVDILESSQSNEEAIGDLQEVDDIEQPILAFDAGMEEHTSAQAHPAQSTHPSEEHATKEATSAVNGGALLYEVVVEEDSDDTGTNDTTIVQDNEDSDVLSVPTENVEEAMVYIVEEPSEERQTEICSRTSPDIVTDVPIDNQQESSHSFSVNTSSQTTSGNAVAESTDRVHSTESYAVEEDIQDIVTGSSLDVVVDTSAKESAAESAQILSHRNDLFGTSADDHDMRVASMLPLAQPEFSLDSSRESVMVSMPSEIAVEALIDIPSGDDNVSLRVEDGEQKHFQEMSLGRSLGPGIPLPISADPAVLDPMSTSHAPVSAVSPRDIVSALPVSALQQPRIPIEDISASQVLGVSTVPRSKTASGLFTPLTAENSLPSSPGSGNVDLSNDIPMDSSKTIVGEASRQELDQPRDLFPSTFSDAGNLSNISTDENKDGSGDVYLTEDTKPEVHGNPDHNISSLTHTGGQELADTVESSTVSIARDKENEVDSNCLDLAHRVGTSFERTSQGKQADSVFLKEADLSADVDAEGDVHPDYALIQANAATLDDFSVERPVTEHESNIDFPNLINDDIYDVTNYSEEVPRDDNSQSRPFEQTQPFVTQVENSQRLDTDCDNSLREQDAQIKATNEDTHLFSESIQDKGADLVTTVSEEARGLKRKRKSPDISSPRLTRSMSAKGATKRRHKPSTKIAATKKASRKQTNEERIDDDDSISVTPSHTSESVSVGSSSSMASRMLVAMSNTDSRASSVVSTAPSNSSLLTQPSPTLTRIASQGYSHDIPPPPFIHAHGVLHHHHSRHVPQVQTPPEHRREASPPATMSTSGLVLVEASPSRPIASPSTLSSSPITRSNCRFHKISLPREENGPRVYFVVPGCSLGNGELMEKEHIEDHGHATMEDHTRLVGDIEALDFNSYLFGVLRQLVGVDLLREQEVFYLPQAGERYGWKSRRKSRIGRARLPMRESVGSRDLHEPESPRPFKNQSTTEPPASQAGSTSTSTGSGPRASHLSQRGSVSTTASLSGSDLSDLSDGDEPAAKRQKHSPSHDGTVEIESQSAESAAKASTVASRRLKPRRSKRLGVDAAAYKPEEDDVENSAEDENRSSRRKRARKRAIKRKRADEAADAQIDISNAVRKKRRVRASMSGEKAGRGNDLHEHT
ncbi:hypothetical protein AcV5_002013 [Taiwanofungus camphoratus]|nr:hypothetical protein AcV5_002013 [Antrodia cinnamomea]